MQVRVSYGSAIGLGLLNKKADKIPDTVYLMLKAGCKGRCSFCSQSRGESEMLSRVIWPEYRLEEVAERIGDQKRVCIQCPNYDGMMADLEVILDRLPDVPISVSLPPLSRENLERLKDDVERVGISIDAATEKIFKEVKPTYEWRKVWKSLESAVNVFGKWNVSTHLIVGLGESEEEMVRTMEKVVAMGVTPSLFAFTPLKGTALEDRKSPELDSYRRIQVARAILVRGGNSGEFVFEGGKIVDLGPTASEVINDTSTYIVHGCPDCDRPYYNEGPAGPFYNWPRKPDEEEMKVIVKEVKCKCVR